jgi:hypothetical protein
MIYCSITVGNHERGVTRAQAHLLHKQNKSLRNECLDAQQPYSQWTGNQGNLFIDDYEWDRRTAIPGGWQMYPQERAVEHPVGKLLQEWAEYGCPTVLDGIGQWNKCKQQ